MAKIVRPRPEEPHPDPSHWDHIRWKVLKRDGFKCKLCGDDEELHVHHITYENWGNEKKKDLTTLCKEHHKLFHRQNKKLKKNTPKCPKCNDIYDVVLTDHSGFYKCSYYDCCHYFNDSGEIVSTYKEDEESVQRGININEIAGIGDDDGYDEDEYNQAEQGGYDQFWCPDCSKDIAMCSCNDYEDKEDEEIRELRDDYWENQNDSYYRNG